MTSNIPAKKTWIAISAEEALNSDKDSFAIPYDQTERVELKSIFRAVSIKITANQTTFKWSVRGLPHIDKYTVDDVAKILRPIFKERLEEPDD